MKKDYSQLHGDWKGARGYSRPLQSQIEAQDMADLITSVLDVSPIDIKYSDRRTLTYYGTAWPGNRRIVVYSKGQTEGTLLHELSHVLVYDLHCNSDVLCYIPSHGRLYKLTQKMLNELWYGEGGEHHDES